MAQTCTHKYPNKGGCGKSSKFRVSKPGMTESPCSMHLSSSVRRMVRNSRQGYVEVEVVKELK